MPVAACHSSIPLFPDLVVACLVVAGATVRSPRASRLTASVWTMRTVAGPTSSVTPPPYRTAPSRRSTCYRARILSWARGRFPWCRGNGHTRGEPRPVPIPSACRLVPRPPGCCRCPKSGTGRGAATATAAPPHRRHKLWGSAGFARASRRMQDGWALPKPGGDRACAAPCPQVFSAMPSRGPHFPCPINETNGKQVTLPPACVWGFDGVRGEDDWALRVPVVGIWGWCERRARLRERGASGIGFESGRT